MYENNRSAAENNNKNSQQLFPSMPMRPSLSWSSKGRELLATAGYGKLAPPLVVVPD